MRRSSTGVFIRAKVENIASTSWTIPRGELTWGFGGQGKSARTLAVGLGNVVTYELVMGCADKVLIRGGPCGGEVLRVRRGSRMAGYTSHELQSCESGGINSL